MKPILFNLIFIVFIQSYCSAESKVVNIFSARQEILMRELIDSFARGNVDTRPVTSHGIHGKQVDCPAFY